MLKYIVQPLQVYLQILKFSISTLGNTCEVIYCNLLLFDSVSDK